MATRSEAKIITLWTVFLLGTVFHTQLALIPLFHGLSVASTHAQTTTEISWILWSMLAFFIVPLGAMVATVFTRTKGYRQIHFALTLLYSVLNGLHVGLDLLVTPIVWPQIALMVVLFCVGLLLNIVAFQWMRQHDVPLSERQLV